MNTATYIARAAAARRAATDSASGMVESIRDLQISKGYESLEASAFTLGYLESFMVSQIMELPVKYREQIISEMRRVTEEKHLSKLNSVKDVA